MTHTYVQADCNGNHQRRWTGVAKAQRTSRIDVPCDERITLHHETIEGIPVLRCSGRIVYGPESDCLFDSIREVLHNSADLVLDLKRITMIDAKGIGALLALHALARAKNGSIRLINANERVSRVLRITNLFGLFRLFDSEMPALRAG